MLIQVVAHRLQENVSPSILIRAGAMLIQVVAHHSQYDVSPSILIRAGAMLIQVVTHRSQNEILNSDHGVVIQSKLLSVSSGSSPLESVVQLISAAVIIFEHSFHILDQQLYLQDRQNSDPCFMSLWSSTCHLRKQLLSGKTGKQSIRDSQKMELVNTIFKIALEYRLPRPQPQAVQHNADGIPMSS
ncbi:uncharacterized protein F5147DRAFT_778055 [Suillus discolor]|uniref:Uncharacterized protein n=1 Tax=Suillus discolor TaxID=1912936 RepID=A0A9P7EYI8_9AGAM|nr:uncharacterized protein F5147DRAFT_778055 [Suillus discolor]KAG2097252.1 hypothetical protein F5147DRAFT_778055 [Suillus discolor]